MWRIFYLLYTSLRVNEGFTIASSWSDLIENLLVNDEAIYSDISSIPMIDEFIYNAILTEIFNETVKDFKSNSSNIHFINYYNYFMGMRVTFNRAELVNSSNVDRTGRSDYRVSNYRLNPNNKFKNIMTDDFGSNKIKYQENGGYQNAGGYIIYFNSNLTFSEVETKYIQLLDDGLFDEHCLSIVLEIMLYNGHYQTGTILSYEFLIDNAGNVFKDK